MAKVKIYLAPGETQRDAEDTIMKAMNLHASGDIHSSHSFQDPAMVSASDRAEETFNKIYQEMIQEINELLDQDYMNKYGN